MNLIEQLGGYEKAKEALHQLKSEKKDLISCGSLVFVESQVIDALLDHRPQHATREPFALLADARRPHHRRIVLPLQHGDHRLFGAAGEARAAEELIGVDALSA